MRGISRTYWLVAAGTAASPYLDDDWRARRARWRAERGPVHMFSRRPRMTPGDLLVCYAVGSARLYGEARVFAVDEVVSEPEPSLHQRWPWQVRLRHVAGAPSLRMAPTLRDIGVSTRSIGRHSHIRLDAARGERAVALIERS